MVDRRFHLAWFTNANITNEWNDTFRDTRTPYSAEHLIDLVRQLERACFDYILLEDTSFVPNIFGGSEAVALKIGGTAPRLDPITLAPLLGAATEHLGIVTTMSTS